VDGATFRLDACGRLDPVQGGLPTLASPSPIWNDVTTGAPVTSIGWCQP
jgi:hypothetical protein